MEKQFEALEIKSRSRQRSAEEIETWVARYRQSGQTQRAFAAAHGIRAGTLARWLAGFTEEVKSPIESTRR